jgi:DNA-binding protein HU-beta
LERIDVEVVQAAGQREELSQRGPRRGRNPRTGAPIEVPAGRAPRFSAGAKLKQAVAR